MRHGSPSGYYHRRTTTIKMPSTVVDRKLKSEYTRRWEAQRAERNKLLWRELKRSSTSSHGGRNLRQVKNEAAYKAHMAHIERTKLEKKLRKAGLKPGNSKKYHINVRSK